MRISLLITGLLALLLVVSLAACGTNNVGTLGLGSHQTAGVQLGGYEVIRYNANGTADSSLNGTLDLRLDGSDLTVSVNDSVFTTSVLLDVKYNAGSVHPVKADFHGLLGNDTQVLSAAFLTQSAGLAGLGEIAIGDYKPGALSGDAVTVHFAPGASRTVSATGIVYTGNVGTQFEHTIYTAPTIDNFTKIDGAANDVHVTWYCGWARADGNQDGLCNVGDLTPLGINFGKIIDNTSATFGAAVADYDDNGQVAIGDLAPLGAHFGQGYEQYIVEGSDNHDGDPMNAIATIPGTPATTAVTPPAATPNLQTIMKSWTVDFTDTSTFTYAALQVMDTDLDGKVRVYVTPSYSGPPVGTGTAAFLELDVPSPGHPVVIEAYDIQAVGATGGTGAGSDIFAAGSTGGVVSNQALTLQLNSVSGTWEGAAFTEAAPYPGTMTAADYATIKAAVAAAMNWTFNNQGAAAARYTSPWFVPTTAYLGSGDPGAGFMCPDDDPESSAASREGEAALDLGSGPIACPDPLISISTTGLTASVGFDMTPDPAAPIIEGYYTGPDFGSKVDKLQTGAGVTPIFFQMTSWGATGATIPGDGTNCKLQLVKVVGNDASAAPTDLTWYTGAGQDPGVGEFYFYHAPAPLDVDIFICKVPGAVVSAGESYAMRFNDGTTWSTINLPELLLLTEPPPPPEDLLTLPKIYGRNFNAPHILQIFMNEPTLRRDGRIVLNGIDGTIAPKDDVAYIDFLKDGTVVPLMEFPVSMKPVIIGGHPGFAPYPSIMMKPGTDASAFTEADGDGIADLSIPFVGGRDTARLTVDISALILNLAPPVPGDPALPFCYKVFGQTADVGTGKFTVPSEPLDLVTPAGAAWGINVGDRGNWAKIDFNLMATNFAINGTTMKDPKPDVFWVRFNGGTRMLAWDEYWSESTDNNIKVIFDDITNPSQLETRLSLAVVGITNNNDYIAIHHLNRQDPVLLNYVDWVHPTIPGGVLNPGDEYNVILDDPTTGGLDYTFTQTMSVTGGNPNF